MRSRPKRFAAVWVVATFLVAGPAQARFFSFDSEQAWMEKASEFGQAADREQDFNAIGGGIFDVDYGGTPVEAGFITLSKAGAPLADGTFIIDVGVPTFAGTVDAVDGSNFAIAHASPSDNRTVFEFAEGGVAAIGFDLGRSDLTGTVTVSTDLGDHANFDISNAQAGFFGLVYDEGEVMQSITFGPNANAQVVFGVDNVVAYTAVVPIPAAGWLLASGLGFLAWHRRRRG